MTQPTITAREQLRIELENAFLTTVKAAFDLRNKKVLKPR